MIRYRFQPLIEMAGSSKLITLEAVVRFEKLYKIMPQILPEEPAPLLHGVLWSDTVLPGPGGTAWLIDTAVYFGYRETDLAMTKLFGGFDERFYKAYNESFHLPPGYKFRIAIF